MNYKKVPYNSLFVTELYLFFKLQSPKMDLKVFYNQQKAFEYTNNEVLPHFLHLMFNEEYFKSFVGEEIFENYMNTEPFTRLLGKIELLSEIWDKMMSHTTRIWDYSSPGYFKRYILTNGLRLDENQIFLWEQEEKGLLHQN